MCPLISYSIARKNTKLVHPKTVRCRLHIFTKFVSKQGLCGHVLLTTRYFSMIISTSTSFLAYLILYYFSIVINFFSSLYTILA